MPRCQEDLSRSILNGRIINGVINAMKYYTVLFINWGGDFMSRQSECLLGL